MNSNQKIVKIVGLLFLIQMITYSIGNQFFVSPVLYNSDFLTSIYQNSNQLLIGTLLEFICGIAIVSIAILLYPILKKHNERIAIWYVGFRIIEFTIIFFSKIKMLSLIPLSKKYVNIKGDNQNEWFTILGTTILDEYSISVVMVMVAFGIGAIMFYYLLYQSRLVPRFIAIWGFTGVLLVLTANIFHLSGSSLGMLIYVPMGMNELFLGVWLLVKGFRTSQLK